MFDVPAVIRKWPSIRNERVADGAGPYLLVEGTLRECIQQFMAMPEASRHLYDILTRAQLPHVTEVLSPEHIVQLERLSC
jgi:hypothetical protein